MWMQYAAVGWPIAEDLNSAIKRLGCQLGAYSDDAFHSTNYDLSICFDNDLVKIAMEDSERYSLGQNLCHKYGEGVLNLDEFCANMIAADLMTFLYVIDEYLPKHIIEKYQLTPDDDGDNDDEMVDCEESTT